jgi:cytoskeleton protein RodZ
MADIGSTLRESRMRARIDISEVEVGTKIRAKYLRALENEEWDLLPGPVYVKSFLKTYGDFLGLDSRLLVDEFKRRYERPTDHEVRAMATTTRERDRGRDRGRSPSPGRVAGALLTPRTVIVLALIVIVAALYVIGNQNGKTNSGGGNAIAPATTGKSSGAGHKHKGSGKKKTGSGTTTTNTVTTNTVTTPIAAKVASLKLVPTSTVWVCVENQAGKPLMASGDLQVGQKVPTFHAKEILLTLGNTGVTMTADGKPYTPSGGAPIGLKITPTGVTPLTPAPTCA